MFDANGKIGEAFTEGTLVHESGGKFSDTSNKDATLGRLRVTKDMNTALKVSGDDTHSYTLNARDNMLHIVTSPFDEAKKNVVSVADNIKVPYIRITGFVKLEIGKNSEVTNGIKSKETERDGGNLLGEVVIGEGAKTGGVSADVVTAQKNTSIGSVNANHLKTDGSVNMHILSHPKSVTITGDGTIPEAVARNLSFNQRFTKTEVTLPDNSNVTKHVTDSVGRDEKIDDITVKKLTTGKNSILPTITTTGDVTLGAKTKVTGDIKISEGELKLGKGVEIHGSVDISSGKISTPKGPTIEEMVTGIVKKGDEITKGNLAIKNDKDTTKTFANRHGVKKEGRYGARNTAVREL